MTGVLRRILAAAALALGATVASAAVVVLNGPAANNVDTAAPTFVDLISTQGGSIQDLNISLDIDASCCAYDLTVKLIHVDTGTTVVLWFDGLIAPGGNDGGGISFGDVLGVTFDDEAATAFADIPSSSVVPPGSYRPYDFLSAFDGESLLGTWRLSIQNTGCCEDEGDNLLAWSITADVASVPEPGSLALVALALCGLGYRARGRAAA